jgi:hypothetical protein
VQRLTLSSSVFGFHGRKGGLQGRKITDLIVGDLLGVDRHRLHESGAPGAKLLDQGGVLCHRCMSFIHRFSFPMVHCRTRLMPRLIALWMVLLAMPVALAAVPSVYMAGVASRSTQ